MPIKLYKKVIFTVHAIISTTILTFMILPELPICVQQIANLCVKNMIEFGTNLMINFNHVGDMLVKLVKWGHRDTSLYPYDPCWDSVLKKKIRKGINSLTNFENIIRHYKLEMCRRAVEVIAEQNNNNIKKVEQGGTEDNSFNLFNVHFSSAGLGIGALVLLVFVYKIIKHSSVKSWKAVVGCIFPCSHCAKDGNPTPTQAQPHHNIGVSNQPNQFNQSNHRTENVGNYNPMSTSRTQSRKYESVDGQKPMQCGPSLAVTQTPSFALGKHEYTTGFEKRLRAYQDQANRQEWYDQQQHGPWVSRQPHWYYTQPDPSFWLSKHPRCSETLMPYSNALHPQQEPHGCSLAANQQQELQHYPTMFQQNMIKPTIQELRLRNQKMDRSSPTTTTTEEENKRDHSGVEATTSKCAPSAPAQGDQPGYTEPPKLSWKPSGGPSYEKHWQHQGYQEE